MNHPIKINKAAKREVAISKMTPEQFYKLDEMKQAELVCEGTHIGERQDEDYIITLYKKDDLYIEVFLHKKHPLIKKFQAFSRLNF